MGEKAPQQCRLCLKDAQDLHSLLDEDVTGIIEILTSIKIHEGDSFPSSACYKCLQDVYLVCEIRRRIIESDNVLRSGNGNSEATAEAETEDAVAEVPVKFEEWVLQQEVLADKVIVAKEPQPVLEVHETVEETVKKTSSVQVFKCPHCSRTFRKKNFYRKHIDSHKRRMLVECEICGTQVLGVNYMKHVELHTAISQICELCGAVAKNAESLRGHMFYMHKSSATQYECEHCGLSFRYKYKYTLHLKKVHGGGEKTCICEHCGKAFFTGAELKRHIRMTHMKLRPYICPHCEKGFSSSYARNTHVRQHTNEKPFKCDICSEGFRQRVSLRTHLRSKHGFTSKIDFVDIRIPNIALEAFGTACV